MNSNLHIAFLGVPGSGKTTAARLFADDPDFAILEEDFGNNQFLEKFYQDMPRWAFHSQSYFLVNKVKQLQAAVGLHADKHVLQDCSLLQDVSYAATAHQLGNMLPEEWQLYQQTLELVQQTVRQPDVIIYLQVKPETALQRTIARGREFENSTTIEYLAALQEQIEALESEVSQYSQWVTFPADRPDLVSNKADMAVLKQHIYEWTNR